MPFTCGYYKLISMVIAMVLTQINYTVHSLGYDKTYCVRNIECLEHNHDKSNNCNFGIFDQMDVLQHNLAGAQSCYVQSTP